MRSGDFSQSEVDCEQEAINKRVVRGLEEWKGLEGFDLPASAIIAYITAMGYKIIPRA